MSYLPELKKFSLLSALSEAELAGLAGVLNKRTVTKGSSIVHAQDRGDNMMFIASGKVKISLIGTDGKEAILSYLNEGDVFGELALITGEPRSADVVALADCTYFTLSKEHFEKHVQQHSGLVRALLTSLALRLRAASQKIGDLVLFDVYRRVARVLKSLGKAEQTAEGTRHVIEARPTHQELASMVGTSREMVTRALKGLEEDRCITIEGKRITVFKLPR